MDSLYSDLPPAEGDALTDVVGSCIQLKPSKVSKSQDKPKFKPDTSSNVTTSLASDPHKGKISLNFVPRKAVTSLKSFKPRQTTPSVSTTSVKAAIAPPVSVPSSSMQSSFLHVSTFEAPVVVDSNVNNINMNVNTATVENARSDTKEKDKEKEKNSKTKKIENENHSWDLDGKDEYDPNKPNDYIVFCEERLEKKKLEKIIEENEKIMKQQAEEREKLENERSKAIAKGDYSKVLNSISRGSTISNSNVTNAGMGRGRGRGGVMNLPAWMVQQQKSEEEQIEQGKQTVTNITGVKRKKHKPSCVVLIKNMVAAGEVDNELVEETKRECRKYGQVLTCKIFQVDVNIDRNCKDDERVRTFVEFSDQASAVKAMRDLNGRFFGGRQISACFYDEEKYKNGFLMREEDDS